MDDVKKTKQRQAGFTLVEVIVVIAIVGIVTGIAVAGYLSWKPGYVYRGAFSQVRGDLNRAKMLAIETRRQWRVDFCGDGDGDGIDDGYQLIEGDFVMNCSWNVPGTSNPPANCPMSAADQAAFTGAGRRVISRDLSDYPGIIVSASGGSPIFSPKGTASPCSLTVSRPDGPPTTINISIAGRVK